MKYLIAFILINLQYTAHAQCDCTNSPIMQITRFATTNCDLKLTVRGLPGDKIPRVMMNGTNIQVNVSSAAQTNVIEIMDCGVDLKWPSTTDCNYRLQEKANIASTNWTDVGIYLGMVSNAVISLPIDTATNRFFRVKPECIPTNSPFLLLQSTLKGKEIKKEKKK